MLHALLGCWRQSLAKHHCLVLRPPASRLYSAHRLYSSESIPPPFSTALPPRRVVVTGIGLVSPLGTGTLAVWNRLIAGECGVVEINRDNFLSIAALDLPSKVAAPVLKRNATATEDVFDLDTYVSRKLQATTSPFIHYALAAAQIALQDSGWKCVTEEDCDRTGVCIGSGIGCVDEIYNAGAALSAGRRAVSAYSLPRLLLNLAAGQVSIAHSFRGPNHSVSTACTTGAHSIGDAYRFIQCNEADVMIAGGSEDPINPISMALFARCRALSTHYNRVPHTASRPFSPDRDGFVMGAGAGVMVLEEYTHAVRRHAPIYAEVRGYGCSADAHHMTAPVPDGRGARLCMRAALQQSGLATHHIDYINAHATSTPLGDSVENYAIKQVFGPDAYRLNVSSTKGAVGHMLGAAGAVEAIFTVLAIKHQIIPPTLNLHQLSSAQPNRVTQVDTETAAAEQVDAASSALMSLSAFDLNYTPLIAQQRTVRAALSNSFGFGGTNASLIFAQC